MGIKSVLLTGGTGTFGHATVPVLLDSKVARVAIYSRDEDKQFRMRRELDDDNRMRWFIGDVRDKERLRMAMRGVDAVIHAAALKHVPAGEYNPTEHVKTNVGGAQNIVECAIECGVPKFLALSTDKAVNPINLYGATKLCAERIFVASNSLGAGKTHFSLVRYGNVLGSRGSFLETLRHLVASGATSYELRSRESTRFWIQAEEAARFVWDRLQDMRGGEIFIPKMSAMRIEEFAALHAPGLKARIVGVPTGEKIHETLISKEESQFLGQTPHHYIIRPLGERHDSPQWEYSSEREAAMVGA